MSAVDLFLHCPGRVSAYHEDGRDLGSGEKVTARFKWAPSTVLASYGKAFPSPCPEFLLAGRGTVLQLDECVMLLHLETEITPVFSVFFQAGNGSPHVLVVIAASRPSKPLKKRIILGQKGTSTPRRT